jgi:hypothetical protein
MTIVLSEVMNTSDEYTVTSTDLAPLMAGSGDNLHFLAQ